MTGKMQRCAQPNRRAMVKCQSSLILWVWIAIGASACGGTDSNVGSAGAGGSNASSGGQAATGGLGSGGSRGQVGSPSNGGSQNLSGSANAGGTSTSTRGGPQSFGGSLAVEGSTSANGGTSPAGGAKAIGGSEATGGIASGGGTKATGATNPDAGSSSTGGTKATGGIKATGGTKATAGASSNGGTTATAGTSSNAGSTSKDRCGRATTIEIPSGYSKLAWQDEFDVDGPPSSSNWGYETGFVRNNELQWYQSSNATISGGELIITGKRERVSNPNYSSGSSDWKKSRQYAEYTSTSMTTSGKKTWKFGRFEMCAKIPISTGMWPAWWALGVSGEWPSNGEIDMMEFYKGNVLANVACGTSTQWKAKWDSSTKSVDASWAASYHFWRMDWNSTQIDLYVDDTLMNSVKLSSMLNADGNSPFLQNAYMIVNLAIGGDNGGDPASTTFPQQYLIDYLRVFQ